MAPLRGLENRVGVPLGPLSRTRNLNVALPEEELQELLEEANIAIGRLMAGLVAGANGMTT